MLNIHKLILLSPAERRIVFRALWLLFYYRLSLKLRPLHRIFAETQRRQDALTSRVPAAISAHRIGQLVAAASRGIPFSTCFSKALAGLILCSENGYRAQLHIGVVHDSRDGFGAHAWLTFSGEIILCNLADIDRYREIPLDKLQMFL